MTTENNAETAQEFLQNVRSAWDRRTLFHQSDVIDCYRIYHGYSEGSPGISIDRYADTAIVNRKAVLPCSEAELATALTTLHPFARIVLKSHQRIDVPRQERVKLIYGSHGEEPVVVRENSWRFLADTKNLHTNGLYLDVREVRNWISANSNGRRVLNMFAHTGSLGLVASLGKAREVVHLDKSRVILETIKENYRLNSLTANERSLMHGDLYYHLPRARRSGQKFSAIILDPPPRVPPPPRAPKYRPQGQDFDFLIKLCCDLLEPSGWLMCIYHSHRKSHDEHDRAIQDASGQNLRPVWQGCSGEDFPEENHDQKTRATAFVYG